MNFIQWLNSLPNKTAIVNLPKEKEIILDIPKELQHTKILQDDIECNKCPSGSTTLWVYTKELNFTLHDGDILQADMLENFTDEELNGFMRLVGDGIIKEKAY